jgi:haloalkane dehalogenase
LIDAADRVPRQTVQVMGSRYSVAVAGNGPPVVLVHGNATHNYTWRNIIPYLSQVCRCIAPDLPGMGRSDVVFPSGSTSYSFDDQAASLATVIDVLEPDRPAILVGHELGATMAIQHARKNPDTVAGLVLLEGAFRLSNDSTFDSDVQRFLAEVRSEAGEDMVLRRNLVVEDYLPRLVSRSLSSAELDAYRAPYQRAGESRRAMLSMIRQLPLQSSPGPIDRLIEEARLWCAQSRMPKLVVGGKPGFLVPPAVLGTAAKWANTTVASVPGLHFLTEDSPARLTALILDWLAEIGHVGHQNATPAPRRA